jgi:ubiquinone/menaquinone biosynthesis C-methylase UbiE
VSQGLVVHSGRRVCLDYSQHVVAALAALPSSVTAGVEFLQADAKDLSALTSQSFDMIVDKGTLDAVLCGKRGTSSARRIVGEVLRLLRRVGSFVLVSHMRYDSDEMQGLLQEVVMPLLSAEGTEARSLRWSLHVFQTEQLGVASVFVLSSQPRRFTRQSLTTRHPSSAALTVKVSTFEAS